MSGPDPKRVAALWAAGMSIDAIAKAMGWGAPLVALELRHLSDKERLDGLDAQLADLVKKPPR